MPNYYSNTTRILWVSLLCSFYAQYYLATIIFCIQTKNKVISTADISKWYQSCSRSFSPQFIQKVLICASLLMRYYHHLIDHDISNTCLTLPPMGGPQRPPPPKKSRKESFPTPCCYIAFLLGIFRDHMQKISQKFQNLSKISGFQKFSKLDSNVFFTQKCFSK